MNFTNVTSLEKLVTANGTNNLTLGTLAAAGGLDTVNGGTGADTINASTFDAALTISSGAGDDTITSQGSAQILSVSTAGGNDSISVNSTNLTTADSIDGGADTDTITLTNTTAVVDGDFTNIDNVEKLTLADGANNVELGTKAAETGIATVTGGTGDDTMML